MLGSLNAEVRSIRERDPAARSNAEVLLLYPGLHALIAHRAAHALYKKEPALHELDFTPDGFEWINNISADECVVVYVRKATNGDKLVVVANFTPVTRPDYKIGVPHMGKYKEIFNSNASKYGGDGVVNKRVFTSAKDECDGREDSIRILLPGMGVSILRYIPTDITD